MSGRRSGGFGSLEDLVAVDAEQEKVIRLGCDLINRLFVLTRNTLLFDLNNDALDRPVGVFLDALHELNELGEGKASLGVVDDNLSLNQGLLKPDAATFKNGQFLHRIYRRLNAQEMVFDSDLSEADLRGFMSALREVVEGIADAAILARLPGFRLVPLAETAAASDDVEIDRRIQVLRTFAGSVAVIARVMAQADAGLKWSPALIRRVAHDLADASKCEPDLCLALLHLPVQGSRLGVHLVRTAVLSLLCAAKLDLPRRARADVAMIALCHHLSKPSEEGFISEETLDTELAVTPADPLHAAMAMCGHGGLNEGLIRRVVGVYESVGRGGQLYRSAEATNLLGRITALSERFASLLDTLRADEALRVLLDENHAREAALCQVFVNTVGLYPVGCVVELESGALAVVIKAPAQPRGALERSSDQHWQLRPVVQIVQGGPAGVVDLAAGVASFGAIVRTRDPADLGQNVVHYFLL